MDVDAPPVVDRAKARQVIDLMVELCQMCHDDKGNPVMFNSSFGPGDQTPRILMRKVMRVLFTDFLDVDSPDGFQPLILELAAPLEKQTGDA